MFFFFNVRSTDKIVCFQSSMDCIRNIIGIHRPSTSNAASPPKIKVWGMYPFTIVDLESNQMV